MAATSNATLWGTVYDSAGHPASNIDVVLDNSSLGFQRTTKTGADGSYSFPEVPPAEGYRVTAIYLGERWDVRLGLVVNVGDEKVIAPPLRQQRLANLAANANANKGNTRDTTTSSVSGVIVGEQLRELPLFNRNFLDLGLLTPNAHDVAAGSPLTGASFSISGAAPAANTFLLDGVENVATSTNQAIPFQVNDSIQEFRVISALANVEFGRTLGGVVNVVTRRGENKFHGSGFGYFANDILNAANPLSLYNGTTFDQAAAYAGSPNPYYEGNYPLTYNDYVSLAANADICTNSISGTPGKGSHACPLQQVFSTGGGFPEVNDFGRNDYFRPQQILARDDRHLQPFNSSQFGLNGGGAAVHDKIFVFGSYEGTRIDNPNVVFERVPSAFDKTYNPLLQKGVGRGYSFGSNDPNYRIAHGVLSLFPAANVIAVPDALEFYRGEAPNYTNVNNGLARADFVISSRTNVTFRYALQQLNQLHDDSLPQQPQFAGNGAFRDSFNQNVALIYSHTFSPTLLAETRFAYNRFSVQETPQDNGLDVSRAIDLPFAETPTFLLSGLDTRYSGAVPNINSAYATWGDFVSPSYPTLDNKFPLARIGAPLTAPSSSHDAHWLLGQSFAISHGAHRLRVGADLRLASNFYSDGSFARGLVYSSDIGQFDSNSESCNEYCAAFQGESHAFTRPSFDFALKDSHPYEGLFHSYAIAGFAQDTWRLHQRVTLNLGLRYDFFSTPHESENRIWNFDGTANRLVRAGTTRSVDPFGNPCIPGEVFPDPGVAAVDSSDPVIPILEQSPCRSAATRGNWSSDLVNLGPRLGIAWDISGSGKTMVRAGIGWFYQPVPTRSVEQLLYNRPATSPNTVLGTLSFDTSPSFCNNGTDCTLGNSLLNPAVLHSNSLGGSFSNAYYAAAEEPFAIYAIDPQHAATPRTRQINLSLQRQVTNQLSVDAGYVGSNSQSLPVVYNSNFDTEFNFPQTLFGGTGQSLYPNMMFFPVFTLTDRGRSNYNALMVRTTFRAGSALAIEGSYTFSKSLDNVAASTFPVVPITANNFNFGPSTFEPNTCVYSVAYYSACGVAPIVFPTINYTLAAVTTTGQPSVESTPYNIPQDPNHFLQNDYGPSDFDSRHRGVINFSWRIPAGPRVLSPVLRNLELSGVEIARSGQPFTIFAGPVLNEITQRANLLGPVHTSDNPADAISLTNITLAPCPRYGGNPFVLSNGQACIGNSGRNAFTGPAYFTTNAALEKRFSFVAHGEKTLTLRAEAFNLWNHANFYNPISTVSPDGFNLNPDFGKIKSAYNPRELQLAVRFSW